MMIGNGSLGFDSRLDEQVEGEAASFFALAQILRMIIFFLDKLLIMFNQSPWFIMAIMISSGKLTTVVFCS